MASKTVLLNVGYVQSGAIFKTIWCFSSELVGKILSMVNLFSLHESVGIDHVNLLKDASNHSSLQFMPSN